MNPDCEQAVNLVRIGGAICDPGSRVYRARGLARQATEDRIRAERTLEVLREKERKLCLDALKAEAAALRVPL